MGNKMVLLFSILLVFLSCSRHITKKNEHTTENMQCIFNDKEFKIHLIQEGGSDADFTTVFIPKSQITTIDILIKGSFDSFERHDFVGNPYQTYGEIPVRIQFASFSREKWSVLKSSLCANKSEILKEKNKFTKDSILNDVSYIYSNELSAIVLTEKNVLNNRQVLIITESYQLFYEIPLEKFEATESYLSPLIFIAFDKTILTLGDDSFQLNYSPLAESEYKLYEIFD
jgi:hypothetical protein